MENDKIVYKARPGTVPFTSGLDSSTSEMESSDTDDVHFVKGSFSQTKASRIKLKTHKSPNTEAKIIQTRRRRSVKRSVKKKYKQTIIVQDNKKKLWYKNPPEGIEESPNKVGASKSEKSTVIPQKKIRLKPHPLSYKAPEYSTDKPQPGDLVMSTADDIHHPALAHRAIHPSRIIIGVVKEYTYVKWTTLKGKEEWTLYHNNFQRLSVIWEPVYSQSTGRRWIDSAMSKRPPRVNKNHVVDEICEIPPTHEDNLKLLCKKVSCRLDGLNPFLSSWIKPRYLHDVNVGWIHNTEFIS